MDASVPVPPERDRSVPVPPCRDRGKTEAGLWRRFERDTLNNKPLWWNYPLLSVASCLLNQYGGNKEWHRNLGYISNAFADGGLASGPECKPQSGRRGTIGTWGVVLYGRHETQGGFVHQENGLCFLPQ